MDNRLSYTPTFTSNSDYTETFTFRAINATSASTSLNPISYIGSGTQVKHTDTGTWANLPAISPVVNNLTIGLTAGEVSEGTSTITLKVKNTGTTAASLDQLVADLTSGLSYVSGSSTLAGAGYSNPTISDGRLVWSDAFSVASMQSLTLTFRVNVPTGSNDQVSGFAKIGDTQIDLTATTLDNVPATVLFGADVTPPPAPVVSSISQDTGISGDSVTSDRTLFVSGTAEPSSTVRLYRGGTLLGTASADAQGAWSYDYTATTLPDGPYSFTATATDDAENTSPFSAALAVTIDGTAPSAPVVAAISQDTGPSGIDGVTSDRTLIVSGTAEPLSTVAVYRGGSLLGTAAADAQGVWSYDYTATSLPDGPYSFTATATDTAGNVSPSSASFAAVVDGTAPSAPAVSAISQDTGTPGDGVTSDRTLIVSGTAEPLSTVAVYRGGSLLGTASADEQGAWSYDYTSTSLPDGPYSFTATATDAAGNTSPSSPAPAVTIDGTAPDAPGVALSVDTGVSGSDRVSSDGRLTISAEEGAAIEYSTDGGSTWTSSFVAVPGVNSVRVRQTDAAGNVSPNTSFTFTLDTLAPIAPIVVEFSDDTGVAGDGRTRDSSLTIAGTAEPNSIVTIFDDDSRLGTAMADDSGAWSFADARTLADASIHAYIATATDSAGNVSPSSLALAVTIDTTPPPAPVVSSISQDTGIPGDGVTSDRTLIISGTAEPLSTVAVYRGGSLLGTAEADVQGIWSYDYTSTSLPDGPYSFTATATDAAGNTSPSSPALAVTIDGTAPSVSIANPSSSAGATALAFAVTYGDAGPLNVILAPSGITVTATGTATYTSVIVTGSGNSRIITLTGVAGEGSLSIAIAPGTAIDAAGNLAPVAGPTSPVAVSPVRATHFSLTSGVVSGMVVPITVTALDESGNVVPGYLGTVHFLSSDGRDILPADAALTDGVGTFFVDFGGPGTRAITARDTVDAGLTATGSVTAAPGTSMAGVIVSSAPQSYFGEFVTLTATFTATSVAGAPMNGTVSFYDGETFLGTAPLVALTQGNLLSPRATRSGAITAGVAVGTASLPTNALSVGGHQIRAVYSGDANYSEASSETAVSVMVIPTVTTTDLTVASPARDTILTANVAVISPGSPVIAGTVSFYDGDVLLGTAAAVDGVATLNIGVLSPGQHHFRAVFTSGGVSSTGGSSAVVTLADVTGVVYLDLDASGVRDPGEPGLPGRVVFADLDQDGRFDAGEPTATTDAEGRFSLPGVASGTARILEATDADRDRRHAVDQFLNVPEAGLTIGVVPISPVAPVPVVPSPFAADGPADPDTALIRSLYRAVLGRDGAPEEVAAWLVRMAGGETQDQVARGFVNSPEHRTDQVESYYRRFLHRASDPTSVDWVNKLLSGVSEEEIVKGFLASPEYQQAHQDATLYVRDLYLDVLGRYGEDDGAAAWQAHLSGGMSRRAVEAYFVDSPEAVEQLVTSFYASYLRRQPDPASAVWSAELAAPGGSAGDVAIGFLTSEEFTRRARRVLS